MAKSTAPEDVVWVHHPIIKMHDNPPADSQWEYKVWMPDWLAEWDVYGDWEVERFNSMRDNLKQGDVLFDIGAELGWQSIIYAQFVGPENMVLIEPSAKMWPNIKATWYKNFPKQKPLACFVGLISDETSNLVTTLDPGVFPEQASGQLVHLVSYNYIHEDGNKIQQITLDDYCEFTGIVPDALTMDIEGGELLVLRGAERTLRNYNLKVWVSIHDELGKKFYGFSADDIHKFMAECGYKGQHLATDHEEHWYFTKAAK